MKWSDKHKILLLCLLTIILCFSLSACGKPFLLTPDTAEAPAEATEAPAPTDTPAPTEAPTPTPVPIAPPSDEKNAFYESISKGYDIPIISVYTLDRAEILSKEEYVTCVVDVFNCPEEFLIEEAAAGIRVRGNSTSYYGDVEQMRENKVPYRIKFDKKTGMLGLNEGAKCKSWVLLKTDWDLIRNDIAFRMGRAIIQDHTFCSDSTFVHLYVNDELQGIYLLCEQSQVDSNRVDINEPEDDDRNPHTGYYMELDNYAWEEPEMTFFFHDYAEATVTDIEGVTRAFVPAEYTIKSDIYSWSQRNFASRYLNNVFTALYEACEKDHYMTLDAEGVLMESDFTSSYEVADAILDLQSVVDMYILYEIIHDNDCGEGSFYMCRDFSPDSQCTKLTFTSPWDFNWAYDGEPAGKYYAAAFNDEAFVAEMGDRSNPWFILLMTEDWFVDLVREKWTQIRNDGSLEACLLAEAEYLDTYKKELSIMDNWSVSGAHDLLTWIRTRMEWLDTQWLIQ